MSFLPPVEAMAGLTGIRLAAYEVLMRRSVASKAELSNGCEGRDVEEAAQWLVANGFADQVVGGRLRFVKIDGLAPAGTVAPAPVVKKEEPKKKESDANQNDFFQQPKPRPVADKPKAAAQPKVDETKLALDLF